MKYRFTSLISGLLAVVTACSPAVDGNLPDSQFYLLGIDGKEIINKTFYDSQTVGELNVNAYLGGYEGTTGEVSLIADDEVLLKYMKLMARHICSYRMNIMRFRKDQSR